MSDLEGLVQIIMEERDKVREEISELLQKGMEETAGVIAKEINKSFEAVKKDNVILTNALAEIYNYTSGLLYKAPELFGSGDPHRIAGEVAKIAGRVLGGGKTNE